MTSPDDTIDDDVTHTTDTQLVTVNRNGSIVSHTMTAEQYWRKFEETKDIRVVRHMEKTNFGGRD